MNNYWEQTIFPWLKALDSARRNASHVLFVEGRTDKDFFNVFLNRSCFLYKDKKIRFKTDEKSILPAPNQSYEFCKKSNPYQTNKKNREQISSYKAVAYILETYERYKDEIPNINCYGLIDKDLGHDDLIENIENIGMTKFHDRESSILRYCLPAFVKSCPNKTASIKTLSEILAFSYKQGMIEKLSQSWEKSRYYSFKESQYFRAISHEYIKNNSDRFNFSKDEAFFENYLKRGKWKEAVVGLQKLESEANIYDFVDDCMKEILDGFRNENELPKILEKWLIDDEFGPNNSNLKLIDKVFTFSNGHILLNQMALNSKDFLNLSNEKELMDYFLSEIIIKDEKYKVIFDDIPLNKYRVFREDNGFYYIESQYLTPEKKA